MSALKLRRRELLYQGRVIRLVREELAFDGQTVVREIVEHPGAVVIAPVLSGERLVFVRQYRRAVRRRLLELPAGTLNPGETPDRCARRELVEETGWRAGRLRRLGRFYAAPGVVSEHMTLFLADRLTRARAHRDPEERIQCVVLPLSRALDAVRSGALCDAKSIIGVLFAERILRKGRAPESRLKGRGRLCRLQTHGRPGRADRRGL